jgi:hypothetical protein
MDICRTSFMNGMSNALETNPGTSLDVVTSVDDVELSPLRREHKEGEGTFAASYCECPCAIKSGLRRLKSGDEFD